jgi:hypothetical protein
LNLSFNLAQLEQTAQPGSDWLSALNLFPNPFTDDLVIEIEAQEKKL